MSNKRDNPIILSRGEDDGRGKRRDAAANRHKILETAQRLFDEQGVAAINMADIAQDAGVGKGTLYRRFTNKGELCLALLDAQLADFQNDILARMQQMNTDGVSKLTQLEHFIDALVYFTDKHAPLLCEVQRAGLVVELEGMQMPHFWQHMTITALLKAAAANREIPQGLDIDYLADAILACFNANLFQFQRQVREFSLERISLGVRTFVSGLRCATSDPL